MLNGLIPRVLWLQAGMIEDSTSRKESNKTYDNDRAERCRASTSIATGKDTCYMLLSWLYHFDGAFIVALLELSFCCPVACCIVSMLALLNKY